MVVSGLVEIALAVGLVALRGEQLARWGWVVAIFFVAVFPGNVWQLVNASDSFGLDTTTGRVVRLFFQPVLVVWALWCTGAWTWWRARRARLSPLREVHRLTRHTSGRFWRRKTVQAYDERSTDRVLTLAGHRGSRCRLGRMPFEPRCPPAAGLGGPGAGGPRAGGTGRPRRALPDLGGVGSLPVATCPPRSTRHGPSSGRSRPPASCRRAEPSRAGRRCASPGRRTSTAGRAATDTRPVPSHSARAGVCAPTRASRGATSCSARRTSSPCRESGASTRGARWSTRCASLDDLRDRVVGDRHGRGGAGHLPAPSVVVPRGASRCAGRAAVHEALSLAREGSRSPPETRLRLVWTQRRRAPGAVGEPTCRGPRGHARSATPDLFDEEAGTVVEYDGEEHRSAARHDHDVRRAGAVPPRRAGVRRRSPRVTCTAVPGPRRTPPERRGRGRASLAVGDRAWRLAPAPARSLDDGAGRTRVAQRGALALARRSGSCPWLTSVIRPDGSGGEKPSRRMTNRVPGMSGQPVGQVAVPGGRSGWIGPSVSLSEPRGRRRAAPRPPRPGSTARSPAAGRRRWRCPAGPWTRCEVGLGDAVGQQPLAAAGLGAARPHRPEVRRSRCESGEGCLDGRPVDLGVVAGDHHGVGVGERGEGLGQLGGGAALPAQEAGHREQGLGHGAVPDDEQGGGVRHADHASRDR